MVVPFQQHRAQAAALQAEEVGVLHSWTLAWPVLNAYVITADDDLVRGSRSWLSSYFEQFDTYTVTLWDGVDPSTPPAGFASWRDRVMRRLGSD